MTAEEIEQYCIQFRRGSGDAMLRLYELCNLPLHRFVRFLCRNPAEAADICQEVWLRVMRKITSLQDPRKFQAWLYAIARRELFRRRGIREIHADPANWDAAATGDGAGEFLIRQEMTAAVSHAVENLPLEQKTVLWLAVVDGLSHRDIARIAGIPEGTARSRLHYALETLRQNMEQNQ